MSSSSPANISPGTRERCSMPESKRLPVRKSDQPEWLLPMLATLTEERFSRQGWLFEPKFDGVRCLVFRRTGAIRLLSRNRQLLNE